METDFSKISMRRKFFSLLVVFFLLVHFFTIQSHANKNPESVQVFREIIKSAVDHNPSYFAQQKAIEIAGDKKLSKAFSFGPKLDAKISRTVSDPNQEQSKFYVEFNIYKFGADMAAYRAAKFDENRQKLQLLELQLSLEQKTAELVFSILMTTKEVEHLNRSLKVKEESVKLTKDGFSRGRYPEQDLVRAQLDYDLSEIALRNKIVKRRGQIDQLNSILPLEKKGLIEKLEWPWIDKILNVDDIKSRRESSNLVKGAAQSLSVERGTAVKSETSVAVRVLESEKNYNFEKYLENRRGRLPTLDFEAVWTTPSTNMFSSGFWGAAISLNIPLWDRGVQSLNAANQYSLYKTSELRLEFKKNEVDILDKSFAERFLAAQKNLEVTSRSLKATKSLYNDSLKRYQMGKSTLNDVNLDEDRFVLAEGAYQAANFTFHMLLVERCHFFSESLENCF